MPERRFEFRRRQIENGVVGLVHARHNERVHEATNAAASPPALDIVKGGMPEGIIQTFICESAAATQLRETRHVPRGGQIAHQALVIIRPSADHVVGNPFMYPARQSTIPGLLGQYDLAD